MSSSSIHPDLAARARWLPRGFVSRASLPIIRRLTTLIALRPSAATRVVVGDTELFVYRPPEETRASPRPAVLWIHGGGLVIGDARQDEAFCLRIARELGVVVASVQYRLAPTHPYPAALMDCLAAFDWLVGQKDVDASRVAVAGASAGGGLAAALCLHTKARGRERPCFQLLVYPMLDDRTGLRNGPLDEHVRVWDRASNRFAWAAYLRDVIDDDERARAVPARAEDVSGLPPAWIGVGSLDLFVDEDKVYAERLSRAGVPCTLEITDGAYHGFDAVDVDAPVSRAFRARQVEALQSALA